MDPDATLADIECNLVNYEKSNIKEMFELCENLYNWLEKDGFAPNWDIAPSATLYYNNWKESLKCRK